MKKEVILATSNFHKAEELKRICMIMKSRHSPTLILKEIL